MKKRLEKETLNLRHVFSSEERLKMGDELAESYASKEQIDEEEAVVKSQFKERRSVIEGKIGSLSRRLQTQFEMRNVECRIAYDDPNPFEVSYYRIDTGDFVKTRPLSEAERQADLPLVDGEQTLSAEESAENAKAFFGKGADEPVAVSAEKAAEDAKPIEQKLEEKSPEKTAAPDANDPKTVAKAKKKLLTM